MIKNFLPKEEKFFQLFNQAAAHLVQAAQALNECLKNPSVIEQKVPQIREIEWAADEITHTTLELLHNTFITPFDRHHIYDLIQGLDDITDLIHATSERLILYHIEKIPPITVRLGEKAEEAVLQVQKAVGGLNHLKKSDPIRMTCSEIHRLENESDVLFRESIAGLFREETNMKILISLKDINEILETISDRCEHMASLIESILLEYA